MHIILIKNFKFFKIWSFNVLFLLGVKFPKLFIKDLKLIEGIFKILNFTVRKKTVK